MKARYIFEKFSEESDPIQDMGIGIFYARNFSSEQEILDWMWLILPYIFPDKQIPDNILKSRGRYFTYEVHSRLDNYVDNYVFLRDMPYRISSQFYIALHQALNKIGYVSTNAENDWIKTKHRYQKLKVKLLNRKKSVNEKFSEDSDPIQDMGIGIFYQRNFSSEQEILDWMWDIFPSLFPNNKIPEDILLSGNGATFFNDRHKIRLDNYLLQYVLKNNLKYVATWHFNNALFQALKIAGYISNADSVEYSTKEYNKNPLKVNPSKLYKRQLK